MRDRARVAGAESPDRQRARRQPRHPRSASRGRLHGDFGLNIATLHLGAMVSPNRGGVPEIHAGKDETSVMLVLAPELVRRERIAELQPPPEAARCARHPRSRGELALVERGRANRRHRRHWRRPRSIRRTRPAVVGRVVDAAGPCSASSAKTRRMRAASLVARRRLIAMRGPCALRPPRSTEAAPRRAPPVDRRDRVSAAPRRFASSGSSAIISGLSARSGWSPR